MNDKIKYCIEELDSMIERIITIKDSIKAEKNENVEIDVRLENAIEDLQTVQNFLVKWQR